MKLFLINVCDEKPSLLPLRRHSEFLQLRRSYNFAVKGVQICRCTSPVSHLLPAPRRSRPATTRVFSLLLASAYSRSQFVALAVFQNAEPKNELIAASSSPAAVPLSPWSSCCSSESRKRNQLGLCVTSVELTNDVVEALKGIFSMYDTDNEEYNEKLEDYKKKGIEKDPQRCVLGGCWWAKERKSLRSRECFTSVLQSAFFFTSSF